jgi:cytochrome P450
VAETDVYYDMYDREIYASPYDTFRRLRNEAPLYFNEKYNFYAVSRHDDLARVLGDILQRIPEWTCDYDNAVLTKGIDTRGWEQLPVSIP